MSSRRQPAHSLEAIQDAVREGKIQILRHVFETASEVLCDSTDIVECVLALGPADFYKPMESKKRPGLWQDVYKTNHHGFPVYLKLQLSARGVAVVISFKFDEDP